MITQITKTLTVKTGNKIMKFSEKRGWRLYTNINEYGKERKITEKQLDKLINNKQVTKVKHERNLVVRTTGSHYIVN